MLSILGVLEGFSPMGLVDFARNKIDMNYQFSINSAAHYSVGKIIYWVGIFEQWTSLINWVGIIISLIY